MPRKKGEIREKEKTKMVGSSFTTRTLIGMASGTRAATAGMQEEKVRNRPSLMGTVMDVESTDTDIPSAGGIRRTKEKEKEREKEKEKESTPRADTRVEKAIQWM